MSKFRAWFTDRTQGQRRLTAHITVAMIWDHLGERIVKHDSLRATEDPNVSHRISPFKQSLQRVKLHAILF